MRAFAVPASAGKKVTGSTPVTSTNLRSVCCPGIRREKGHWFVPIGIGTGNLHKSAEKGGFFMTTFTVYIIFSARLDTYYIGYTSDLGKRLLEHNAGVSTFTAKASDWIVCWSKLYHSRQEAAAEEKRIKRKKSRKYIEWLINNV